MPHPQEKSEWGSPAPEEPTCKQMIHHVRDEQTDPEYIQNPTSLKAASVPQNTRMQWIRRT